MVIKPTPIIPFKNPKSLVHHIIKYELNLLLKDINHIKYLANYCTLDLFLIIMNDLIYCKSISPKEYPKRKLYKNINFSRNGRYINNNYDLIDITNDKTIHITKPGWIDTHIKNNGEITFFIINYDVINDVNNLDPQHHTVIHSSHMKDLTQKSFDQIIKNSNDILQNGKSTNNKYAYIPGRVMKCFDNDYILTLGERTIFYYKKSNEWKFKFRCNSWAQVQIILKHSNYNPDLFDDIVKSNYQAIPFVVIIPVLSPDSKFILYTSHKYRRNIHHIYHISTGLKIPMIFDSTLDSNIKHKWINKHDLICYYKYRLIKITINDENIKLVVDQSVIVNLTDELLMRNSFTCSSTIIYNSEHYPIYLINNAEFKHINDNCVFIWQNEINGTLIEVAEYLNIKSKNEIYCYDKQDYPYSLIHRLNPGFYLLNLKYKQIIKLDDKNIYVNEKYCEDHPFNTVLNLAAILTPYGFISKHQDKLLIYNFYANMLSILAKDDICNDIKYDHIINKSQYETEMTKIYYHLREK